MDVTGKDVERVVEAACVGNGVMRSCCTRHWMGWVRDQIGVVAIEWNSSSCKVKKAVVVEQELF
jgi:hypothetical protein